MQYVNDYATLQEVYSLLQRCDFPLVPTDWPTAYSALKDTRSYVVKRDGKVVVWIGYHSFTDKMCDLDICVAPEVRGVWATKGLIRDVVSKPLLDYGLEAVRIEAYNPEWRSRLLQEGFSEGYSGPSECIFTHADYEKRFGHVNG